MIYPPWGLHVHTRVGRPTFGELLFHALSRICILSFFRLLHFCDGSVRGWLFRALTRKRFLWLLFLHSCCGGAFSKILFCTLTRSLFLYFHLFRYCSERQNPRSNGNERPFTKVTARRDDEVSFPELGEEYGENERLDKRLLHFNFLAAQRTKTVEVVGGRERERHAHPLRVDIKYTKQRACRGRETKSMMFTE